MSGASTHIRPHAALPLVLAGCLAMAGAARADGTGSATPASAGGNATTLAWDVDGLAPPVSARIPRSLVVTAPGFTLDRRAVATRCSELQAKLNECPRKSKIGTGWLSIVVHRPNGTVNEVKFDLGLYLAKGTKVFAVTDFIGIRVVPGRLTDAGGVRVTFDPLPTPPEIPGVELTYEFKGVSVTLGAKRTEVRRVGARRARRTFRYSLVRTPERCAESSWAATATLGFPDGTSQPLPTPMACTRR